MRDHFPEKPATDVCQLFPSNGVPHPGFQSNRAACDPGRIESALAGMAAVYGGVLAKGTTLWQTLEREVVNPARLAPEVSEALLTPLRRDGELLNRYLSPVRVREWMRKFTAVAFFPHGYAVRLGSCSLRGKIGEELDTGNISPTSWTVQNYLGQEKVWTVHLHGQYGDRTSWSWDTVAFLVLDRIIADGNAYFDRIMDPRLTSPSALAVSSLIRELHLSKENFCRTVFLPSIRNIEEQRVRDQVYAKRCGGSTEEEHQIVEKILCPFGSLSNMISERWSKQKFDITTSEAVLTASAILGGAVSVMEQYSEIPELALLCAYTILHRVAAVHNTGLMRWEKGLLLGTSKSDFLASLFILNLMSTEPIYQNLEEKPNPHVAAKDLRVSLKKLISHSYVFEEERRLKFATPSS